MSIGFDRRRQPEALDRAAVATAVMNFLSAEDIAVVAAGADPFMIDDPCPFNQAGHRVIASCGEVVCRHCSKVFWR